MIPLDHLGSALKRLRGTRGLKQQDVAKRGGITKAMLSSYERGRQLPRLPSLVAILDALHADLRELEAVMQAVEREEAVIEGGAPAAPATPPAPETMPPADVLGYLAQVLQRAADEESGRKD